MLQLYIVKNFYLKASENEKKNTTKCFESRGGGYTEMKRELCT